MTFYNTCDKLHPMKIVAMDGATGGWRWIVESASTCTFEAPQFALRQDLAVVVASPGNTSGLPGLMVLDGATGQPLLTPAIPQSTVTSFDGSVLQGYSRIGAPMVDSDGTIVMQYEQRHVAYPPRVDQSGIWLLKVAPNGATSTTQLANITTDTNLFPGRVIPDGAGGAIATWTFSPSNGSLDPNPLRAAHAGSGGVVTEFALPIQPSQLLKENNIPISPSLALGENGTAFVSYGSGIASFNFSGGTQWTAQPAATKIEIIASNDENGVVAKVTDGGGADALVSFSATGALMTSNLPPMGGLVEQVSGEFWTGVDNGELNLYANVPVSTSSVWSSWNQRRTNQALSRASIEVKCRPISQDPANPWWQKVLFRIAVHCYIVTREQNGTVSTIEGGEVNGHPTGTLKVEDKLGDSAGPNRPTDTSWWWSPALPWLDDAQAQTRIACIKARVPQMHAAQLAYYFLGPNSNRAVVELTEACGISTVYQFMPAGRAPGFLTPFTPPWY